MILQGFNLMYSTIPNFKFFYIFVDFKLKCRQKLYLFFILDGQVVIRICTAVNCILSVVNCQAMILKRAQYILFINSIDARNWLAKAVINLSLRLVFGFLIYTIAVNCMSYTSLYC